MIPHRLAAFLVASAAAPVGAHALSDRGPCARRPRCTVAGRLGCTAGAAAVRCHRALERLEAAVPGDLLDGLVDD